MIKLSEDFKKSAASSLKAVSGVLRKASVPVDLVDTVAPGGEFYSATLVGIAAAMETGACVLEGDPRSAVEKLTAGILETVVTAMPGPEYVKLLAPKADLREWVRDKGENAGGKLYDFVASKVTAADCASSTALQAAPL